MRPLDICVTGDASSPHESKRAQALAALGHRVRFVSPVAAELDGIPVTVPWGGEIRFRPLRRLAVMLSTLWVVAREKANVIHCHYAAEYATWAAALLGKKPLVITVMGGDVLFDEQGNQGPTGRALTRFALRRADLITVKSPRLARVVESMGVAGERIMEVLWGIDLTAFASDSARVAAYRDLWRAGNEDLVFFSPRPMKPFYNQPLMIQTLAQVREKYPGAKLVMTTYGEEDGYRDDLLALAKTLGVDDALHFVDPCLHVGMAHLYGAADIVLSIPPSDGFPQTLVEAAVIGRPCVMTGAERFAGLIEPDKHALFTELNPDSLAKQCLLLAEKKELRQEIANAALEFSKIHADLMKEAQRVSNRMQEVVKNRKGAAAPLRPQTVPETHSPRPLNVCVLASATPDHTFVQCGILHELGHNVTLVSQDDGVCVEGVPHISCSVEKPYGVLGKLRWLKAVYDGVKAVKADIYHAHYAAELTTWMAWLLRKRPLVISCLGGDVLFDEQGSLGPVGRWLTRRSLLGCDQVTTVSNYLADIVEGFGVTRSKIRRIVWGVNHNVFYPSNMRKSTLLGWGVASDAQVIFSPRQLRPLYNQHLMVEAFREIVKRQPKAILAISTYNQDDVYRSELEELIDRLGVRENIRFLPPMTFDDMRDAYSSSDLVLSLPSSDGTPVSVMEAMACGTPVIIGNLERYNEFFTHKETAWFVKLDSEHVGNGVITLLRDAELCGELKHNAMVLVKQKADLHTQTHLMENIFHHLIAQKKSSAR